MGDGLQQVIAQVMQAAQKKADVGNPSGPDPKDSGSIVSADNVKSKVEQFQQIIAALSANGMASGNHLKQMLGGMPLTAADVPKTKPQVEVSGVPFPLQELEIPLPEFS